MNFSLSRDDKLEYLIEFLDAVKNLVSVLKEKDTLRNQFSLLEL